MHVCALTVLSDGYMYCEDDNAYVQVDSGIGPVLEECEILMDYGIGPVPENSEILVVNFIRAYFAELNAVEAGLSLPNNSDKFLIGLSKLSYNLYDYMIAGIVVVYGALLLQHSHLNFLVKALMEYGGLVLGRPSYS
ncbi:hypothetical protein ACH5RR_001481 [Cinchona calisaya]|uniref:Uncharacterized protein n=1 Tax=Cinchona calisaya TaxID=153742 RepID=A0ABD3B423_9GENT